MNSPAQIAEKYAGIAEKKVSISFGKTLVLAKTQLLAKTDYTVSEIARWVGYASLAGFYAAFKNQYGCLPTEYRKKNAK